MATCADSNYICQDVTASFTMILRLKFRSNLEIKQKFKVISAFTEMQKSDVDKIRSEGSTWLVNFTFAFSVQIEADQI